MEKRKPLKENGLRKGVVVFDGSGNAGYFDGEQKALYSGNKSTVEKYLRDVSGKDEMPFLEETQSYRIADRADSGKRDKKIQAALYALDMAPDIAALLAVAPFEYGQDRDSKYALARILFGIAAYAATYFASKRIGKEVLKKQNAPEVFLAGEEGYRPATCEDLRKVFPEKSFWSSLEKMLATSAPYLS